MEEDEELGHEDDYVYDTISEPYVGGDGLPWVDVLLFTSDGHMTSGTIKLPTSTAAEQFMKYFRENVDPLSGFELHNFIETHRRRTMQ